MPDPARIFFCRAGFVLFCLLPTLLVGGWIVRRSSGEFALAQRDEWQHTLASRLGLSVEIERVSYPNPATARLEGVQLLDPETRAVAVQAGTVEIVATTNGWQIEAWQPQIAVGQLGSLARILEDRLLRGGAGEQAPCDLAAYDLTLHSGPEQQTLSLVSGRFEPTQSGPHLTLDLHLSESQSQPAAPMHVAIARQRQASPPVTEWRFDTAGHALPCNLAVEFAPALVRLGRDCRIAGAATWTSDFRTGTFSGTLDGVDLDALVTEQFPHRLSGQAVARIERATIAGGKLTELRGTLAASGGSVSPSLLTAAAEHLQLAMPAALAAQSQGQSLPFRRLAVGFHLDGRVLRLSGSADPTRDGALLASAAGPLLSAPLHHAAPATNLARALLPESEFQVPATRQTDALVALLPLPDPARARTAALPAHTPTRLAPASGGGNAVRQPGLR
jgi:hypothetical protein